MISDEFQVPVFSLLSERHDANFLTFWLREFIRLGGSVPKEYISDMSMALLNAGAIAFGNRANLDEYIDTLFRLVRAKSQESSQSQQMNNSSRENLPPCHVRIDIAHLMKSVANCKPLKTVRPKVKEMFVRCVANMILETSFQEMERHILDVLIVAGCETRGLS